MPLYEYQCPSCSHEFELKQSFNADPYTICPRCEAVSRRSFTLCQLSTKGLGFIPLIMDGAAIMALPPPNTQKVKVRSLNLPRQQRIIDESKISIQQQ